MQPDEIAKLLASRLLARMDVGINQQNVFSEDGDKYTGETYIVPNKLSLYKVEDVDLIVEDVRAIIDINLTSSFNDICDAFEIVGIDNIMWFMHPVGGALESYIKVNAATASAEGFFLAILSLSYPEKTQAQLSEILADGQAIRDLHCYVYDLYHKRFLFALDDEEIFEGAIPYTGDGLVLKTILPDIDNGNIAILNVMQVKSLFDDIFLKWKQRGSGLSMQDRAHIAELLVYATRLLPCNGVDEEFVSEKETINAINMVRSMIEAYSNLDDCASRAIVCDFSNIARCMEIYATEDDLFLYPEMRAKELYDELSNRRLYEILIMKGNQALLDQVCSLV